MPVKKYDGEIYIDLIAVMKILWRNGLTILLTATLLGAITFGYLVFLVAPKYEAEVSMYVNNSSFTYGRENYSILETELGVASTLSRTCIYILETRETIEQVIKETGLDYTYEEIMEKMKMLSYEEISGTGIFRVIVQSESPTEAELIANTIVKVLPTRLKEIVDGSKLRTVSFAIVPSHRAVPHYVQLSLVAFFTGALISGLWTFFKDLKEMDKAVTGSASDLRKRYPDIPILSLIPDFHLSGRKGSYYSSYYVKEENSL